MPHETWGAASDPINAAEVLQLDTHLAAVPGNGTVFDLGAGIGLSLAAAIHIRRPDVRVFSVDSGFHHDWDPDYTEDTIDWFPDDEQAALRENGTWRSLVCSAELEALPFREKSAHLIVSFAAASLYSETEATLLECQRVLDIGGAAVLGPIPAMNFRRWEAALGALPEARRFSAIRHDSLTVSTRQAPMDVYVATLKK